MAALGVGGFGLLTSPTSTLGMATPHRRLVRELAPGPRRSNFDLIGLGGGGGGRIHKSLKVYKYPKIPKIVLFSLKV